MCNIFFENKKFLMNSNILNSNKKNNNNKEIRIIYAPQKTKNKRTKIFGSYFVNYNKYNCKIIFKDSEYDLISYFNLENVNEIKLKINKNLKDISHMFEECELLLLLPDFDNLNTSNIVDMNNLFYGCKSLLALPDISNWDISKVTNMSSMFNGCSSLSYLPNIEKWDLSNVTDIDEMFKGCISLCFIPKMNFKNYKYLNSIFNNCISLSYLPESNKITDKFYSRGNLINLLKY